jgi:hypothetical protein
LRLGPIFFFFALKNLTVEVESYSQTGDFFLETKLLKEALILKNRYEKEMLNGGLKEESVCLKVTAIVELILFFQ